MSSTDYTHDGGEFITERVDTGQQVATVCGHIPYRHLTVTTGSGTVANDGADTATVTIAVVDGLEVARGSDPGAAAVLDYDGGATVEIDGSPQTVQLSGGSAHIEITTGRPAGSEISVRAVALDDHPAESDSATIQVKT